MSTITTASLHGAGRRVTAAARALGRVVRRVPKPLWVIAAAVLVAAVGAVELTGAIAGMLYSHHPVLVGPLDAGGVLHHWLTSTGVRRGAWPADVAAQLGRFRQVRAALVLAIVLLGLAAVGCWALWRSTRVERLRDVYKQRGARWASGRELARLHVKGPTAGRVILGRRDGQLLASEANASTLIVAPSQAGKTSGLAVPAMIEWDGPILATSVKGDLLVDTLRARREKGEVKVFDPTDSTEVAGSAWSPVAAATSWSAARRLAASILQVGMRQHGGQDDSFWRQAGASHLAPLLLAGNYLDVSTSVVLTWATSTDEAAMTEPLTALRALVAKKTPGADRALHDLQVMQSVDSRFRSNVIGTLSTHLDAWKEPALEAATAHDDGEGITPEWLLDGTNTLYLSAPAAAQRRLRGLFCALVTEVIAAAFERAARTGRPLDPKLLLMMDEAANIAPLPNIDEIASTGPGQGVLLCTILQNLSQAEEVWGKDRADTILANHRARLFGAGIGDTATLEYISRILGDEVRETTSISRKRAAVIDLGTRSESLEHRALLGHHETRQIPEGHTLLIYGQLPPTQLALRPWFKDAGLRRLVEGATPRRHRPTSAQRVPSPQHSPAAQTAPPTTRAPHPPAAKATPPRPTLARSRASAAIPAAEQLSFEDAPQAPRPAPQPAAPKTPRPVAGVPDVRGRLERQLGRNAADGVAALRLAVVAGNFGVLVGPLALVLQDSDDAPSTADWQQAELLADVRDRAAITARLLEHGAACEQTGDGGSDRWIGVGAGRLLVHFPGTEALLDAIVEADTVKVDGVGALRVADAELVSALTVSLVVGD